MSDQFEQARQRFFPDHPGEKCDCPTCERVRSGEPLLGVGSGGSVIVSDGGSYPAILPPARLA